MAYNSLRQQDSSRLVLGVRKDVNTLISSMSTTKSDIDTVEANIVTLQGQLNDCSQSIVTASRALGTVYQNTSGKTMRVSVSLTHTCLNAGNQSRNVAYVEADDTTPDTAVAQVVTSNIAATMLMVLNMSFDVPANSYYKVTDESSGGGTSSISYWTEWTIL